MCNNTTNIICTKCFFLTWFTGLTVGLCAKLRAREANVPLRSEPNYQGSKLIISQFFWLHGLQNKHILNAWVLVVHILHTYCLRCVDGNKGFGLLIHVRPRNFMACNDKSFRCK